MNLLICTDYAASFESSKNIIILWSLFVNFCCEQHFQAWSQTTMILMHVQIKSVPDSTPLRIRAWVWLCWRLPWFCRSPSICRRFRECRFGWRLRYLEPDWCWRRARQLPTPLSRHSRQTLRQRRQKTEAWSPPVNKISAVKNNVEAFWNIDTYIKWAFSTFMKFKPL